MFDQDYLAAMARFLDPGDTATSGATLIVNGVEANSAGVSPSAIKEVRINEDLYSAEFARPGRGRIEVITKPGSPEYHGTFNFIFRDAHLNARDPFALTRPPEQRRIYEGVLTGPIRHSKSTSFLFSVDRNEEDLQNVVFARGPAGIIQENAANPTRGFLLAGQIDRAFNQNNNLTIRYSFESKTVLNQGVGGNVLPEAGTNSYFQEHQINISHEKIFSPQLVNDFLCCLVTFIGRSSALRPLPGSSSSMLLPAAARSLISCILNIISS